MNKDELLHKWLNNYATFEETEILKKDPEYAEYLRIASTVSEMETPVFNRYSNWEAIESDVSTEVKVRRLNPVATVIKVAAVIAVLLAAYLFVSSLDTTVNTQVAQKEQFLLPDSSEVTLNAESRVVYNRKNWGSERSLELEGEAYFKVAKGEKFSVVTPAGIVSVLGTEFNVYNRHDMFDIRCFEGLVSVEFADTLVNVAAGNLLKIKNNELLEQRRILEKAPPWITDESSFVNAPLSTVLEELERQYPIVITSPTMVNKRFSGSFTHTNLEVALRSICDPLKLEFTLDGDQVTIDAVE